MYYLLDNQFGNNDYDNDDNNKNIQNNEFTENHELQRNQFYGDKNIKNEAKEKESLILKKKRK